MGLLYSGMISFTTENESSNFKVENTVISVKDNPDYSFSHFNLFE